MILGPDRLSYTPDQAAHRLQVERCTVYRWIKAGKLRAVKVGTKLWRVPASEIVRLRSIPPSSATAP